MKKYLENLRTTWVHTEWYTKLLMMSGAGVFVPWVLLPGIMFFVLFGLLTGLLLFIRFIMDKSINAYNLSDGENVVRATPALFGAISVFVIQIIFFISFLCNEPPFAQ